MPHDHNEGTAAVDRWDGKFWRAVARVDRLVLWLGWAALAVAAFFVAVLFLLLISAALTRPWSNFMFGLAYEAGSVLMWPISFLPLAAVWRVYGHVRFDLFLRLTRGRIHHVMELLGGIVVTVVALLFIWQCWSGLMMHYRTGTHTLVFRYAVWPFFAAALVGSVVLFLELLTSILRSLREVIHPTGVEESIYGAEAEVGL